MRYLLLKVHPLIHNLFLQQRINFKKKKKIIFDKVLDFQNTSQKLPKQFKKWESFRSFKTKFNKPLLGNIRPLLPKILFATTTEIYSSIVVSAASKCHMPFHVERWLSGTITAGASYLDDFEKWSFFSDDFQKDINNSIQKTFLKRKKNISQQANQIRKYQFGRKPSLIIIPDVSNNEMIIKETNAFGIPVLGLINSDCNNEIAYPIFANDHSIYSIHFFCHFLSSLITKEIIKNKHKLYIAPKRTKGLQFSQAIKEIFNFNTRIKKFKSKKKKKYTENKYFFKGRYFLENFVKPKIKIKKNLKYRKKSFFLNKPKKTLISPKKLIHLEARKRFQKDKRVYYLKKNILPKIKFIQKLHHFNFSKTLREIRMPENKPRFRFWNQNKFFFSNTLRFTKNTSLAFQFQRFVFPKLLKKRFWNAKRLAGLEKRKKPKNFHLRKNFEKKKNKKLVLPFRKRWPFEKLKKEKFKK